MLFVILFLYGSWIYVSRCRYESVDSSQLTNLYKVSATFKRYYARYQHQIATVSPETNVTRVMAAYECILVEMIHSSHM